MCKSQPQQPSLTAPTELAEAADIPSHALLITALCHLSSFHSATDLQTSRKHSATGQQSAPGAVPLSPQPPCPLWGQACLSQGAAQGLLVVPLAEAATLGSLVPSAWSMGCCSFELQVVSPGVLSSLQESMFSLEPMKYHNSS